MAPGLNGVLGHFVLLVATKTWRGTEAAWRQFSEGSTALEAGQRVPFAKFLHALVISKVVTNF